MFDHGECLSISTYDSMFFELEAIPALSEWVDFYFMRTVHIHKEMSTE